MGTRSVTWGSETAPRPQGATAYYSRKRCGVIPTFHAFSLHQNATSASSVASRSAEAKGDRELKAVVPQARTLSSSWTVLVALVGMDKMSSMKQTAYKDLV